MSHEQITEVADVDDGRSGHVSRRSFVTRGALAAGVGGVGVMAASALAPAVAEAAYAPHGFEFQVGDYGAVGDGRTDDTAAIQRCINAAVSYAGSNGGFARVLFEDKTYAIKGAMQTTYNACMGQLIIPGASNPNMTIELVGAGTSLPNLASGSHTGTLLLSNSTASFNPSPGYGLAVIAAEGDSGGFSGTAAVIRDLHVRVPANPTIGGINLVNSPKCTVERVTIDTELSGGIVEPRNFAAQGLLTPIVGNHSAIDIHNVAIAGFYCGIKWGEHASFENINIYRCKVALAPYGGDAHLIRGGNVSVEHCPYVLAGHYPGRGVISVPSSAFPIIDALDIEDAGTGDWAAPVYHVNDGLNNLRGEIRYIRVVANQGPTRGLTNNGATGVVFDDILV